MAKKPSKSAKAKTEAPETIPMKRDPEIYPDGPHTADVHPSEVENYRSAGYTEA